MTALVRSEWLRLRSRLAVMGLLGSALVIVSALMIGQFLTHEDDYSQALARFRTERAAAYETELATFRSTRDSVGSGQLGASAREVTRAEYVEGLEFMGGRTEVPTHRFVTKTQMVEMAKVTSTILAMAAFLAGATFAGADWASRVLHGLLLWEGRRVRVLFAKLLVLIAAVAAAVLFGQIVAHGIGFLAGAFRGTLQGVDGAWWFGQAGAVARGAGICVFTAALGFGLAFAARGTGFALGVGFLYLGVLESLLIVWKPRLEPYSVRGAANTFLDGGRTFVFRMADGSAEKLEVGLAVASGVLAVYTALCLSATVVSFTRRDVV